MVRLTLNKPYTLHARSIDRITGTPSDYKLNLKDPITCDDDHHIKATLGPLGLRQGLGKVICPIRDCPISRALPPLSRAY